MTREQLKNKFPNASEAFLNANTSQNDFVGAIPFTKPKPHTLPALDQKPIGRPRGKGCVRVCVTFISFRRSLLDDDNLASSLKGLRDAVAKSIGLDDGDSRFKWQYTQVQTTGEQGTLVKVETYK